MAFCFERARCTLKMNSISGMSWSRTRGLTWRIFWSSTGTPEETPSRSPKKGTAWRGRIRLALGMLFILLHTGHTTPPGSLGLKSKVTAVRLFPQWIMSALWMVCRSIGLKGNWMRERRAHYGRKTNPSFQTTTPVGSLTLLPQILETRSVLPRH